MEENRMEWIKIYPSNWLMTAGIVGFVRIFGDSYIRDSHLEISQDFINNDYSDKFSSYLSNKSNVYGFIGDFYNNSPFAQIWQKSMKDTLIELGVDKEKAEKYEQFASDKKKTFLKSINSVLKKLKNSQIPHQKFLDKDTIEKVLSIFEEYKDLLQKIDELSKKKKILESDLPDNFNELVDKLNDALKDSNVLQQLIRKVAVKLNTHEESNLVCSFCSERKAIKRDGKFVVLDEKHFTPIAASADNLANLYWEGKPANFLCLPCELIIYCAAFGFTKYGENYVFINAPTSLKEIVEINKIWAEYIRQDKEKSFKDSLIQILKRMEKIKAKWSLQNISFIELVPYSENSFNIHTFNIPIETAYAIRKMINDYPKSLVNVYDIFLDYIYSKRPLYDMVGTIFYGYINRDRLKAKNLDKSLTGRLILAGKNIENPKDLLFYIKFQKEVEEYE